MKRRVLSILAAAAFTTSAVAGEYYVAVNGNDSNAGTIERPFKTIAKATSVMVAGDECIIREGVYNETLKSVKSGKKDQPITYKSYNGEKVVIDASEVVDGWSRHSGDIYKANVELKARQAIYNTLFFDDEVLDIARWPNNEDGDKFTFDGHRIDGGSGSHFEVSGLPSTLLTGGYFCYLGAHSGTSWSRRINSHNGNELKFDGVNIKQWPYTPHNPTILRNKNRGQLYVYGKLELLDCPGEWFYDSHAKVVYAMFPGGVAPKKGSVKAGVRPTTVELNHNYIMLDGISCFGGEVRLNGNNLKVSNGTFKNCSQTLDGLIGISAQSNTATFNVRGGDIIIDNNLIEGGLATGIAISPERDRKNYLIYNNVIRYFDAIGIHANAIRSRGRNTTILNNTIYTCGRDAICTSGEGTEIAYNDMYDCMRINNDGGVFYTVGNESLRNTEIHHNYVHDSYGPAYADGRAAGIYLDNNSKGFDVHHNVIWNVTWSALMINWYNTDIKFYNNTIWDCGFNMGRWANGYRIERIEVKNNYANISSRDKAEGNGDELDWIGTEFEANVIETKSPFTSAENRDFTLPANSSLIDKGVVIKGFKNPYEGKSPDVGAYEFGEERWNVGASWASEVAPGVVASQKLRSVKNIESEDEIFKKMLHKRK